MVLALVLAAFVLSFAPPGTIGPPWLVAALAIAAILWVALQPLDADRDDLLPALAVMLTAFGLLLIARVSPDLAHKQQYWLLISLALVICAGPLFTRYRRLAGFKYIWILASFVLFLMLLIFGHEVNGARLWIQIGPIQLEPVELIKLFMVLFLAAYLAETADVIATAKPWSIRSNLKYLGPLFIGWGTSMAILVLQRDLGMATLLLATFAVSCMPRPWIDLVAGGFAVFGLVAYWAVHHYSARASPYRRMAQSVMTRSAPDTSRRKRPPRGQQDLRDRLSDGHPAAPDDNRLYLRLALRRVQFCSARA